MEIKRKTKTEFKPFTARLLVHADPKAMTGHNGTPNPAADLHRFPVGEGEFLANTADNAKYGDQVIPSLIITVPGFGHLTVSPSEVKQLLVMLEEIQAKSRNPGTFVGREATVSGTV